MIKKLSIALTIMLTAMMVLNAQPERRSFMTYYESASFMQVSPGAMKFGLYGWNNPAINTYTHDFDALFAVSTPEAANYWNFNRWGLFMGSPFSGFGALTQKQGNLGITDYRFSTAFGDRAFSLGLGYGFTGGDKAKFGRSNIIYGGALIRPIEQLSLGASYTWALDNTQREGVVELAIRPLSSMPISFFADMAIWENQNLDAANWSVGTSLELISGIRLNGRYFENESVNLGVDISLGSEGYGGMASLDKDQELGNYTTFIRMGALDRTIMGDVVPIKQMLVLDLSGPIKYQSFQWFDNSRTLLDLVWKLRKASEDESVQGISINLTNISANMEMMWELREALREFKERGKEVIVFIDRTDIRTYHLASIADKIIMDPLGTLTFEGFLLGRSFYKNMLEKLDIGFEELRYFKYKSAAESYSRDKMSEADREQRQSIVDDWYDIVKKDISKARGLTGTEFDELVNTEIAYLSSKAMAKNLIDKTGRWNDRKEVLKDESRFAMPIPFDLYMSKPKPFDDKWSAQENKIAVVYAIGACAMDEGIKARSLVEYMKSVCENDAYKAVVLRVDSPGGDALASDYIAEVVRKFKDKKPIVVSQGMVAGSGGYWLSMDATKIVASPMTITGSIGVISFWMYDKGAASSLGITTDKVQRGKYADLGYSFQMPLVPIGLPVRNLNEDEKSQFEKTIRELYDEFTGKVATGRGITKEKADELGQGRVYSGLDGRDLGLVDEIGGLMHTIDLAAKLANIHQDEDIVIDQYPKRELFDFSSFMPSLIGVDLSKIKLNQEHKALLQMMESRGTPMTVMPLEYYDFAPSE